jgi:hypothetical protein
MKHSQTLHNHIYLSYLSSNLTTSSSIEPLLRSIIIKLPRLARKIDFMGGTNMSFTEIDTGPQIFLKRP